MLGRDAARNEYWFFKEEPNKLFVKQIHKDIDDESMQEVITGHDWLYYDSEEEIELLIRSLNNKGIREKKLMEILKKIHDKLKLKKKRTEPTETSDQPVLHEDEWNEFLGNALTFMGNGVASR